MERTHRMMRRTKLRTHTGLSVKKNAEGKPRERFEGLRLEEYREHIRHLPCILAGAPGHQCWHPEHRSDACHVITKARGAGDAGNLVPMCRRAHDDQHSYGIKSFEREYATHLQGQRLGEIAGALWLQWERDHGVASL
jgi:hypothetical protein